MIWSKLFCGLQILRKPDAIVRVGGRQVYLLGLLFGHLNQLKLLVRCSLFAPWIKLVGIVARWADIIKLFW